MSKPILDRLMEKVIPEPNSGCWIFMGAVAKNGYGYLCTGTHQSVGLAHRLAYEALVGPIPAGLHLDHKCRVRCCVNPEHLEPVSCRENVLRGVSPSAVHARKMHCDRGHPFDEKNTYTVSTTGQRKCRECRRVRRAMS